MTEKELDSYAGQLGDAAMATTGDPISAASVLIQAAVAVLIAKIPGAGSIDVLESLTTSVVDSFRGLLEPEGPKH